MTGCSAASLAACCASRAASVAGASLGAGGSVGCCAAEGATLAALAEVQGNGTILGFCPGPAPASKLVVGSAATAAGASGSANFLRPYSPPPITNTTAAPIKYFFTVRCKGISGLRQGRHVWRKTAFFGFICGLLPHPNDATLFAKMQKFWKIAPCLNKWSLFRNKRLFRALSATNGVCARLLVAFIFVFSWAHGAHPPTARLLRIGGR